MMLDNEILLKVKEYVRDLFERKSPDDNVYHSFKHTEEVVNEIQQISREIKLTDEDLEVLLIAAWFHDVGYVKQCEGHEDVSIEFARNFLNEHNYPKEKIEKIASLINATRMPQKPKNLIEEIICDADLHHVGLKDFEEKGDLLRLELEKKNICSCTDHEWLERSLKFLDQHKFFTPYAREKYQIQKNINVHKIEKTLKKLKKNQKAQGAEVDNTTGEDKISKKKTEKTAGRSIETMFRNTMRTHVSFSSMADTKANIMISVNTLVLTIIVSVMIRKLDTNPHLIIPTALLTITSLVTLVYAILVTRPKVTSGIFTSEDIKNKKANLLFFGNFFNMSLKDFAWGMKEMISDQDYLYDSMINDFYYLGQVLGQKYQRLRYSYTIFMYGIIISVLAFAIAFMLYPEGTDLGPIIE
jgi:predicted metal-dependent HD superfamily phosphohydrolase